MSRTMLTYDLGKRAIYNYFVLGSQDNRKVNLELVDAWYPQTAKQEEIYILQKLLNLAHGKDGERFQLSENQFRLSFMISDYKAVYKKTGELVGYQRDREAIRRAVKRFDDFKSRGYIEGNPTYLSVTFSGRLALENKLCVSDTEFQRAQAMFSELAQNIMNSAEQQSANAEEVIQQLHKIMELLDKQASPSFGETISTLDTTMSVLEKFKGAVPEAITIISKIVSLIG